MIEVLIGLLVAGWLVYKWWTYPYRYWEERGFPSIEANIPLGSSRGMVMMDEFQGFAMQKLYNQIGEKGYAGIIFLRRPHLMLKDPEIIKAIMLKDFPHFTDRVNVDNINEPLSHHLFNLGGDKWKALRVKMTPTFTSGKLKLMFPLFEMCSKSLEEVLDKLSLSDQEVDVKDLMGRFTTKIVGTCAYGIEINSLSGEENEFVTVVKDIFPNEYPSFRRIIIWLQWILPGMEKILKFRFISVKVENFLRQVVMDTMSYRKNLGTKRNDFIDLLMEIREQKDIKVDSIGHHDGQAEKKSFNISDDDLVAQVFVFLVAGYETSSSVTSYCLYELAENPDIQEKLREEILSQQPLNYQAIQEMSYLDMVVHETMRKYPTIPILTRKCTKQYRMPDGAVLEKGIRVLIPVYALHHDPEYFPNPEKFDPERFSSANKNSRPQFSYLPFGEGPRLCIGMRFGLLQTKMGIVTILSKYRVEKSPNTVSPLKFVATPLISSVGHSIKLSFKPL